MGVKKRVWHKVPADRRIVDPQPGDEKYDPVWDRLDGYAVHVDRRGRRISMRQWCEYFERVPFQNYRQIAEDRFLGVRVSTIWTGTQFTGAFETMVFSLKREYQEPILLPDGVWSGYWHYPDLFNIQTRYTTEKEALEGHYLTRHMVRWFVQQRNGPRPLCVKMKRHRKTR